MESLLNELDLLENFCLIAFYLPCLFIFFKKFIEEFFQGGQIVAGLDFLIETTYKFLKLLNLFFFFHLLFQNSYELYFFFFCLFTVVRFKSDFFFEIEFLLFSSLSGDLLINYFFRFFVLSSLIWSGFNSNALSLGPFRRRRKLHLGLRLLSVW